METHEHDWKKGPVVLYSPDDFVPMRVEVCKACNAVSLVDEDDERHEMDEKSQTDMVFKVEDGTSLAQVAKGVLAEGEKETEDALFWRSLPAEWQGRLEHIPGTHLPMILLDKKTGEEMSSVEWRKKIFGD